ncbi:VOC family protein [Synechococcus sp. RSCCF101]|uniref:VOC family protein n=1 Tax=Synechococcus sp. RSCCF101 TaxID=2511069 RepID=UPI001246B934|nr:VOC family protein [Synechococcus sp. RSCCF101]QEY31262.1 VOC family protein [Synechococcus sp. RSCCF101]
MPGNPVSWFELGVSDMARARRFYETVLGVSLTNMPTEEVPDYWAFPMRDDQVGAGGALTLMPQMPPGPGGTLVYFQCDDCSVEEGRVEPAGGRVLRSKRRVGHYGCIAICEDTEGNPFGLYSQA